MTFDPERLLACRLQLAFDPDGLARDAAELAPEEWVKHFNNNTYQGEWSGASFRSPGGDPRKLSQDLVNRPPRPYELTPLVARCPAVAAVIKALRCPLGAVRFLRLMPGARILPHRDYDLGFDSGAIRLHVPVTTDPAVRFVVGGVRLEMQPGEVWYGDFQRTHEVENASARPRVHLVIDCQVDEWIQAAVAAGTNAVVAETARSLYD